MDLLLLLRSLSLRITLISWISPNGSMRSPWVVVVTGSSRCMWTDAKTVLSKTVFFTFSQLLLQMLLESWQCRVAQISSTQFTAHAFPPWTHSTSNMEELRSLPSYHRETGFGLLFGSYRLTKSTVYGLLPVRLISWNPAEPPYLAQAAATPLARLSIGVLNGQMIRIT